MSKQHPEREALENSTRHEFACRVAEDALCQEKEAGREPDGCLWAALAAKRQWLRGEISGEELAVAATVAANLSKDLEAKARAASQSAAWANADWDAKAAAWGTARGWDAAAATAWAVATATYAAVAWGVRANTRCADWEAARLTNGAAAAADTVSAAMTAAVNREGQAAAYDLARDKYNAWLDEMLLASSAS